jgi:hypothetical protein
MFGSVWNWIKTTVNYYFYGNVKEELVEKINQPETTKTLSEDVKQSLLESIIQNKPKEFIEKLQNDNNNIPKKIQDDLILSMIRASQMYVNPMTEIPNTEKTVKPNEDIPKMTQSISVNKNWKKSYDLVINQIKFKGFIRDEQEKMKKKQRELCQIMYIDNLSKSHCIVVHDDRKPIRVDKPKKKYNRNNRNNLNNMYNRVSYKNQRNNSKNNRVKMDCKWNQHF